jgi:hypothetical protein
MKSDPFSLQVLSVLSDRGHCFVPRSSDTQLVTLTVGCHSLPRGIGRRKTRHRVRNQHHAHPAINVRRSAAATAAFDRTHDHGAADDAVPQPIRLHTRFGVLPRRVCHMAPPPPEVHAIPSLVLLLLHRVTEPCMSESSERHVARPNPTSTVIYVIQL